MAANFWGSSQFKHLLSKSQLKCTNPDDRARGLSEYQVQQIKIYFYSLVCELARHAKLRQRVAATAMTYFRRFYAKNSFTAFDPRLIAPGCLYVASKCEESIIAAKHLVLYMKKLQPSWAYDVPQLLETEMILLEELDYNLILYDPYGPLQQYLANPTLHEVAKQAWCVLNDLYRVDLCLIYPPHLLALGCISFAACIVNKDIGPWLEELQVNMNQVYDIASELNLMYVEYNNPLSMEDCHQLLDLKK
jgi:cyclin-C